MSPDEHQFLGDVLLISIVAFFGLGLPGYWLLRKVFPEKGWNHGGNVSTAGLKVYDLLGIGMVACLLTLAWKGQGMMLGKDMPEVTTGNILLNGFTFLSLAAIIPSAIFWRTSVVEFFGLRWPRWLSIFWIVPVFIVFMIFCALLFSQSGWKEWVESLGGELQPMVKALQETGDVKFIGALIFGAVIAAPIAEEIIFRGYIYPVAKRFTERNFAALFSAVLFGVAHFNLMGLPVLFLFGIAMVIVYEQTGSIWAPIGCHMAFNGLQITQMLASRYAEQHGWSLTP